MPQVVGKASREVLRRGWEVLLYTPNPLSLVGPTGSGKTLIGLNLIKAYSRKFGVPAYYLQMGPDVTRTTLVGGFRLVKGSLVPVKGVVMRAMDSGGIVFLDEFTHAHVEEQVALNSALSSDHVKVVGLGEIESHAKPTTRFIIAHNPSTYAGNTPLPPALRRRVVSIYVPFPGFEEEVEIAKEVASRSGPTPPEFLIRWLTSIAVEVRTDAFPICASNVAAAALLILRRAKRYSVSTEEPRLNWEEPVLLGLYARLHGVRPKSVTEAGNDPMLKSLCSFLESVRLDAVQDTVLEAFGGVYMPSAVRDRIVAIIRGGEV